MDLTSAVLTALGLAGAAGLNAYLPLLVVAVLDLTGVIALPAPYDQLASWPVLVALGVLATIEFLADKVPAVDSVNDVVQTVVRPAAGALLAAGSLGLLTDLPPWVGGVAGLLTAGGVHAAKATARPAINVATGGAGGPVVSLVEDGLSLLSSVLAVLAPLLLLLLVAGVAIAVLRWRSRVRRGRSPAAGPAPARRDVARPRAPDPREADPFRAAEP